MFRFEGLDIWKRAAQLGREIMEVAEKLDRDRKYKIADQLRGATLSISNNIAEGSGSFSKREFKAFLNYAHRSAFETANIITICRQSGWVSEEEAQRHLRELEEIAKMITGFSRSL